MAGAVRLVAALLLAGGGLLLVTLVGEGVAGASEASADRPDRATPPPTGEERWLLAQATGTLASGSSAPAPPSPDGTVPDERVPTWAQVAPRRDQPAPTWAQRQTGPPKLLDPAEVFPGRLALIARTPGSTVEPQQVGALLELLKAAGLIPLLATDLLPHDTSVVDPTKPGAVERYLQAANPGPAGRAVADAQSRLLDRAALNQRVVGLGPTQQEALALGLQEWEPLPGPATSQLDLDRLRLRAAPHLDKAVAAQVAELVEDPKLLEDPNAMVVAYVDAERLGTGQMLVGHTVNARLLAEHHIDAPVLQLRHEDVPGDEQEHLLNRYAATIDSPFVMSASGSLARRNWLISMPDDPPKPVKYSSRRLELLEDMVDNLNQRDELGSRRPVDRRAIKRLDDDNEMLELQFDISDHLTPPLGSGPRQGSSLDPDPTVEGTKVVTQTPEESAAGPVVGTADVGPAGEPAGRSASTATPAPPAAGDGAADVFTGGFADVFDDGFGGDGLG
ncbi:MAG TPA: hypothetical protein VKG45_05980 [Actinomycetes bacterium]|nr:hypothetical protein [Actinomycetes bacterium]